MPDFLYDWPLWVTGLLMIGLLVAIAQVAAPIARRFHPPRLKGEEQAEFTSTMVHSMMVFYGLVTALIAVNVWESHAEVSRIVSKEASALAALYRDASGYPEPVRSQIKAAIRDYVDLTIHESWPQQHRGVTPRGGVAMVDRIEDRLLAFEPATEGQKVVHAETLRAYDTMVDARRLRVDANHQRLPGLMWMVNLLGAILCLVGASLFRVESAGSHPALTGLLAALIGMILFMTLALERPYRGDLAIGSESYQLVHEQLMQPQTREVR
jgi:hypothetical protein